MDMKFNQNIISSESNVSPVPTNKGFWDKLKNNFAKNFLLFLALILVLFVLFFGKNVFDNIFNKQDQRYVSIFLVNGQVYFGKIEKNDELEIVLSDVFFVQINQDNKTDVVGQAKFNIAKIIDQLHGPTDEIFINRSQVVFYENLRDDSKVLESIKGFKR